MYRRAKKALFCQQVLGQDKLISVYFSFFSSTIFTTTEVLQLTAKIIFSDKMKPQFYLDGEL